MKVTTGGQNSSLERQKEMLRMERNQNNAFEKKIRDLKEIQNQAYEKAETIGEAKLDKQNSDLQGRLTHMVEDYENKLGALKENIASTKKNLEEEKKELLEAHQEDVSQIKSQSQDENLRLHSKQEENAAASREEFQNFQHRINSSFDLKTQQLVEAREREMRGLSDGGMQKINEDKSNLGRMIAENQERYMNQINLNKAQHEAELRKNNHFYAEKLKEQEGEHQFDQNRQSTNFQEKMLLAKREFEKKFYQINSLYHQTLGLLTDKSKKNIEDLKKTLVLREQHFQSMSKDPFYRPKLLEPQVKEMPDHYLISVSLPSYEENMVTLAAKGREIRVSRSRDYKENIKDLDGSTNKYAKVETFSKTFMVDHLVDAKKVTKSYKDGVLTFTLPKA